MERPINEVKLDISGMTAEVYTYYLRGDKKTIENIMMEAVTFEEDDSGKTKRRTVDSTYRAKMEDKAVLLAVKKFVDKDGKEIEPTVEVLDNLPDDDFKKLQDSLPSNKPKKK
jgi:hypothetical protein